MYQFDSGTGYKTTELSVVFLFLLILDHMNALFFQINLVKLLADEFFIYLWILVEFREIFPLRVQHFDEDFLSLLIHPAVVCRIRALFLMSQKNLQTGVVF